MIADVTGVPVLRSTDTEVGAKGAFLVGLAATGGAPSVEEAAPDYVRLGDTYTPDAANTALYAGLYADFLTVRDTTAGTWPQLATLRERSAAHAAAPPAVGTGLTEIGTSPGSLRRPQRTNP